MTDQTCALPGSSCSPNRYPPRRRTRMHGPLQRIRPRTRRRRRGTAACVPARRSDGELLASQSPWPSVVRPASGIPESSSSVARGCPGEGAAHFVGPRSWRLQQGRPGVGSRYWGLEFRVWGLVRVQGSKYRLPVCSFAFALRVCARVCIRVRERGGGGGGQGRYTYTYEYMRLSLFPSFSVCIYIHAHARPHAHTRTHTHTHIHIHTHTHTHMRSYSAAAHVA